MFIRVHLVLDRVRKYMQEQGQLAIFPSHGCHEIRSGAAAGALCRSREMRAHARSTDSKLNCRSSRGAATALTKKMLMHHAAQLSCKRRSEIHGQRFAFGLGRCYTGLRPRSPIPSVPRQSAFKSHDGGEILATVQSAADNRSGGRSATPLRARVFPAKPLQNFKAPLGTQKSANSANCTQIPMTPLGLKWPPSKETMCPFPPPPSGFLFFHPRCFPSPPTHPIFLCFSPSCIGSSLLLSAYHRRIPPLDWSRSCFLPISISSCLESALGAEKFCLTQLTAHCSP